MRRTPDATIYKILALSGLIVTTVLACPVYLFLSITGLLLHWQGEWDLRELYGSAGRGDWAAAERVVAPADRGRVALWTDYHATGYGRPVGIRVVTARTDLEFGSYGWLIYRVRFPDGAVEHGSAFVWRGKPLDLPPLTLERQIQACHSTVLDPTDITFSPVRQKYASWEVDYTVKRANGEMRDYRAKMYSDEFSVHALLPDGSRGEWMAC